MFVAVLQILGAARAGCVEGSLRYREKTDGFGGSYQEQPVGRWPGARRDSHE